MQKGTPWCSTLLKEYGRPWRICCWICATPPWYEWDIWLNENIIVGLYLKHFFKWELSKWRLAWSGQGEEYTCKIKVIQFSKNAASSQEDFFAIQDNIMLFCGKKRKSILYSFEHIALLKGMLYVNNTAYMMQKYGFV